MARGCHTFLAPGREPGYPKTYRLVEEAMQTKDDVLEELRTMFRNLLAASAVGGSHARVSRARGCVDGYMRALLDLGVVTRGELVSLIAAERTRANGAATATIEPDIALASCDDVAA
jgi:hypothetical protein